MKLLILTASKDTLKWKSLPRKLQVITNVINSGKNADWEVSIEYVHTTPVFFDGRILHEWLDAFIEPFFQKGYDVVGLHFSNEQRTQWGMKPTLGGSNPRSDKEFGQFYLWADEHSTRYGENRFIQNVLHEFKHEYHQQTGILDDTHTIDKRTRDVSNSFQKMDWALYQPVRQELKRKLSLYKQLAEAWRMVVALTNKKKGRLQPLIQQRADAVVESMALLGHPVRIAEGYRSPERQNELYAQGRTTKGNIVTNAKAGESLHQYGVAVDFVFRKEGYNASDELWDTLGVIGKSQGFEWGNDWLSFKDKPHFQMTLGYSLKDFQSGKVDWSKWG